MNVQHLESLNDSIAELTDVRVRETSTGSGPWRRRTRSCSSISRPRRCRNGWRRARLPAGAGGVQHRQLLPRRETVGAARAGAARGGRGRRAPPAGGRARPAEPSRRSPSGCSRWSRPSRARSGCCAGRGARPSSSAPSSTRCGCTGENADRRSSSRSQRWPAHRDPRRALPGGGRGASCDDPPPHSRRAQDDLRIRRRPRTSPAPGDPARLARLGARTRAARGRHPRRGKPRRPGEAQHHRTRHRADRRGGRAGRGARAGDRPPSARAAAADTGRGPAGCSCRSRARSTRGCWMRRCASRRRRDPCSCPPTC